MAKVTVEFDTEESEEIKNLYEMLFALMQIHFPDRILKVWVPKTEGLKEEDLIPK